MDGESASLRGVARVPEPAFDRGLLTPVGLQPLDFSELQQHILPEDLRAGSREAGRVWDDVSA